MQYDPAGNSNDGPLLGRLVDASGVARAGLPAQPLEGRRAAEDAGTGREARHTVVLVGLGRTAVRSGAVVVITIGVGIITRVVDIGITSIGFAVAVASVSAVQFASLHAN